MYVCIIYIIYTFIFVKVIPNLYDLYMFGMATKVIVFIAIQIS